MSVRIPLQAVANQAFTIQLDDVRYSIRFNEARGIMAVTIQIEDVTVVSGARVLADVPLIPFEYQEGDGGNFIFTTVADAIPYYTDFDITHFLFYLTPEEVANARVG